MLLSITQMISTIQLPTGGRATCRIGIINAPAFNAGRPFAFRYQGNGATPCQNLDTTRKATDCATTLPLTVLYNETLQQTFRPLLSKLYERRQILVFDPHFEEVWGGVEPWLMARWKARVRLPIRHNWTFFASSYCWELEALQGKTCQDSLLPGGVGHLEPRFQAKGVVHGEYFFGFYKTRHILLPDSANCTVLRAVVMTQYWRVTDRQTDRRTELL